MGALPKRRISSGRRGRRRQDKMIEMSGRGALMTSRARRAAKKTVASNE